MRKRRVISALVAATCCAGWIAGCAGNNGSVVTKVSETDDNPVEDAVRVPTEEVMPEDAPEGLRSPAPPAEEGAMDAPMTAEEIDAVYRIGPSDRLEFRSFDDETLNTSVVVRHDGMISLPWIPDVEVGGLTREEATEAVREAYQELYFEAEVSLQITEAVSKTYTVMGDVSRPSEFPYTKPITLLDAIISAGGLRVNQRAGDTFVGGQGQLVKAYILRGAGDDRTATEYDLRNIEKPGPHETDAQVLPGDTIYIPEGLNLVYVLGAVGRPGIQPLTENMTLLQLLAASSGFNESIARMEQVVLIREVNENETEVQLINLKLMLKTGQDVMMQPGDVVYVPRKRLVSLGEFVSRATGVVSPIIGITSQALGLYTQAYDAYYADERADLLYDSPQSNQLQTNLQLLEAIRQIGEVSEAITGTN